MGMSSVRAVFISVIGLGTIGSAAVAAQGPDDPFTAVYERLRRGAEHSRDVPAGRIERTRVNQDGLLHRYVLIVPENYDPSRRYPVAFYLHGGVARPDPGPGGGWWRNDDYVVGHDRIAVLPLSWDESFWWQASQIENLQNILSELKRTYNVDENRVYAFGTSDGGTGVYFLGFRDVTPWAAFLPFIGDPAVLLNPGTGADGRMHLANLANRPFFIVNGETDPLYPVSFIGPFLDSFRRVGGEFVFTAKPGGHNTSWWPEEAENMERFIETHPRDPHPNRVRWATERTDRYNRAHWVVIDELGPIVGDSERGALEALVSGTLSGVVEAVRNGNTVTVEAYHIRRLRLLISPDAFDLRGPIRVIANGEVAFEGIVKPDTQALTRWAAKDEDRTMLYAAEVTIELEPDTEAERAQ
jgi:predicted esterase